MSWRSLGTPAVPSVCTMGTGMANEQFLLYLLLLESKAALLTRELFPALPLILLFFVLEGTSLKFII